MIAVQCDRPINLNLVSAISPMLGRALSALAQAAGKPR